MPAFLALSMSSGTALGVGRGPLDLPVLPSWLVCASIEEVTERIGRLLDGWPTQWATLRDRQSGDIVLLIQPVAGPLHFSFTFRDGCMVESKAYVPEGGG